MTIDEITAQVIERIKEKYFLIEKTYNLEDVNPLTIKENLFMETAMCCICEHFSTTKEMVLQKYGKRIDRIDYTGSALKSMFVQLCRSLPEKDISYTSIGKFLNNSDHSKAIYWHKTFNNHCKDKSYLFDYKTILKSVNEKLKLK